MAVLLAVERHVEERRGELPALRSEFAERPLELAPVELLLLAPEEAMRDHVRGVLPGGHAASLIRAAIPWLAPGGTVRRGRRCPATVRDGAGQNGQRREVAAMHTVSGRHSSPARLAREGAVLLTGATGLVGMELLA